MQSQVSWSDKEVQVRRAQISNMPLTSTPSCPLENTGVYITASEYCCSRWIYTCFKVTEKQESLGTSPCIHAILGDSRANVHLVKNINVDARLGSGSSIDTMWRLEELWLAS